MAKARTAKARMAEGEDGGGAAAAGAPAPLELMGGKPWHGAFLTSYALSLSFLETQVLPALQGKERCAVEVLVDAKGYRDSLFERHSGRAGQDYRLVPVALPNGCFHPKVALLWGPSRGLLLVGSGNLTFGGHGRNLEVFEVFDPARDAPVFAGFAAFLEALQERHGARMLDAGPAARALAEARRMAGAASPGFDMDVPRLLHSVRTPICEQVAAAAGELGMGRCLGIVVMSPYFDPDGGAVRRLAEALGCGHVRVAVPPAAAENRFPFAAAAGWPMGTEAVRSGADARRRVHAKVLELTFEGGTFVLTGSVNATRPALTSTDNVEVGVLRFVEASPFPWIPAPTPPGVLRHEAAEGEDGQERLVHAVVTGAGRLVGRVLGAGAVAGAWRASIGAGGAELLGFPLEVAEDGGFAADAMDVAGLLGKGALQLVLARPDGRARGWLQMEGLLSGARLGRMPATAVQRLTFGQGTPDDVSALLEYLARHLVHDAAARAAFRRRVDPSGPAADATVGLADLETRPGWRERGDAGHGAESRDLLERIREHLLRRPTVALSVADEGVSEDAPGSAWAAPGAEGGGATPRKPAVAAFSIAEFEDLMRKAAAERSERPADRAEVLTIWFEGMMTAHLHAPDERCEDARRFLGFWTMRALAEAGRGDADGLDALATTVAAMTFAVWRRAAEPAAKLASLRSVFERWWGGEVARAEAHALLSGERLSCVAELVGLAEPGQGRAWDASAALDGLLAVATR